MDFKLNFLGVTVADFDTSFRFYTETLGIGVRRSHPGWALFDTTGMTFELFGGGMHRGGADQNVTPSLFISDVESVAGELRQKGVQLIGDVFKTSVSSGSEFLAPEGLVWSLESSTLHPRGENLARPHIGAIRLGAEHARIEQMIGFYGQVMGLNVDDSDSRWAQFSQGPDEPTLFLIDEGTTLTDITSRRQAPHFLSFETKDAEQAAQWLRKHNVPIIEDLTARDWGGVDIQILDPAGNPVQVVQYITDEEPETR